MMAGRRTLVGFLGAMAVSVALLVSIPGVPASSAPAITEPYRADTVLVRFRETSSTAQRAAARAAVRAVGFARIAPNAPRVQVVTLPEGSDVPGAIARLQADPSVVYAEPDYLVQPLTTYTSNDPSFTDGSLWGMYGDASSPSNQFGSQAAEAWAAGYVGSSTVVVGVIDEGQQWNHPDLAANEWVNPDESTGVAGRDDDGNGYIDDIHGWDFYANDASTYDGSGDDHGTHVSGTIGAVGGNGVGVAGVNWNVKIIPAKFLGANGGYTSGAVSALYYLIDLKSRHNLNLIATSNSWGGGGFTQTLLDAITASGNAGMLFVAAAGNSGLNIDRSASYPAGYVCQASWGDCVISVAAISSGGSLANFSNYGSVTVDLGAPGVSVLSTLPGGYGSYSGTSMATPHVTGAVALCESINSSVTMAQLRAWVLDGAPTTSLSGKTVTGDRLDVGRLWKRCDGSYVEYNLTVTFTSARGTVTMTVGSSSQSCTNTCVRAYEAGTVVTLTARAAKGYRFLGWSGEGCSGTGSCVVTLSAARGVTANFAK